MRRSPLFTRLLVALAILFACAAALSAMLAGWTLAETLERQYRSKGVALAETIAEGRVDDLLIGKDVASLQALADHLAATEGVGYILVRDPSGDIITHTFAPEVPAELRAADAGTGPRERTVQFGSRKYIDIMAPILGGELGVVHVGMKQESIDEAFWQAIRRQWQAVGVVGLLALTAAYYLVRRLTRPLSRLAEQARALAAQESLVPSLLPVAAELAPLAKRGDEVGYLAAALAQMIEAVAAREERLKLAEQYYRSLIENVSDVILLLDGVGVARYLSPSLRGLVGCDPADWLGRDVSGLIHPDDRAAFRGAVESGLSRTVSGEAASVEVRVMRLDGVVRIADASFTNLLHDPAVGGVVVTLRDISDRKRTHELGRAREQAEEASRLKSQLLANISHEFYTPMHQIFGLAELTLETEVSEEQRENLQMLRTSAGDLMAVLQNILDFSTRESDAVRLEERSFAVDGLLHDVFALVGPAAKQKGLRLDGAVAPEVPATLVGDADRLRQVLLQVVGNAVKFTASGEVVAAVAVGGPGWLLFSVRDTGPGIPAELAGAIFEPFVQADGSSKRRFGGTGLGLAIARSILDRFGGRIWLESRLGKGSTFHFTVPLRAG